MTLVVFWMLLNTLVEMFLIALKNDWLHANDASYELRARKMLRSHPTSILDFGFAMQICVSIGLGSYLTFSLWLLWFGLVWFLCSNRIATAHIIYFLFLFCIVMLFIKRFNTYSLLNDFFWLHSILLYISYIHIYAVCMHD